MGRAWMIEAELLKISERGALIRTDQQLDHGFVFWLQIGTAPKWDWIPSKPVHFGMSKTVGIWFCRRINLDFKRRAE